MILGPDAKPPLPAIHASVLATLLDSLRYVHNLPALAGAIVTDTGLIDARAVGSRRYSGPANVTDDDQFHLGSCTKAMTATLIGKLIDEGRLQWTTTLLEVFPELSSSMCSEYRSATVHDILTYSAGLPRELEVPIHTSTAKEQRAEIVAQAVRVAPAQQRGRYLYSNLGYIVAGIIWLF